MDEYPGGPAALEATDARKGADAPQSTQGLLIRLLQRRQIGLVAALLGISLVYALFAPGFLTAFNLINVLTDVSIVAIAAVGGTMVILLAGIDLSTGSVLNLSGSVAALYLLQFGLQYGYAASLVAVLLAIAAGLIVGASNAALIALGRLPPFIATLATLSVFQGIAELLTNAFPVPIQAGPFVQIGQGHLFGIPYAIIVMAIVYVAGWLLLNRSKLGRQIYAIGGNATAARLSGVRSNYVTLFVYVVAGGLCGVSAVILAGQLTSGQPVGAVNFNLDVIAAVVVGGTSLMGGRGSLVGTFLGAVFIAVLDNGLTLLNVQDYVQMIVGGLVIAFAVMLDGVMQKRSMRWR
jgi:ribose transport system permease protein